MYSLAGARFVTGNSLMQANLSVSSPVALRQITIFNGNELFRRFRVNGTTFHRTLLLDGYVHRNLVLEATDVHGATAVANVARSWKPGVESTITFCNDHVNDCGDNLLSHGPAAGRLAMVPALPVDIAGDTWDGGPPAVLPLLQFDESRPVLRAVGGGGQDTTRAEQTPMLEQADEGSLAITSANLRMFGSRAENVINTWQSWGPLGSATPLFDSVLRFRLWGRPSVGMMTAGYPGAAEWAGSCVTLFRSTLAFKKGTRVEELVLAQASGTTPSVPEWSVVYATDNASTPQLEHMRASSLRPDEGWKVSALIQPGGWFAAFSSNQTAQASIYWNRGATIRLQLRAAPTNESRYVWASLLAPDPGTIAAGAQLSFELAQFGASLQTSIRSMPDVLQVIRYLESPSNLRILGGERVEGAETAGILQLRLPSSGNEPQR